MTQRFLVLDSFRGLCALSVVVFHLHVVSTFTEADFFRGSGLLVEFFFVLSGFVLSHGYAFSNHLSFKQFAVLRSFRLFPLHIVMLVVFILFEFGKLAAYQWGGLLFNSAPFTGLGAPSEILPNFFLVHAWSSLTDPWSFNSPSWSISIEYYIYFIFFATLLLFKSYKILAWTFISFVMLWLIAKEAIFPVLDVQRGLSCFFAGGVTYYLYSRLNYLKFNYLVASLLEALLLVLVVCIVASSIEYRSLISTFLFCATVFIYSFEVGFISSVLKRSVFTRLGELSYSIYMTHAAVIFILVSLAMVMQKITGLQLAPMVDDVRFVTTGYQLPNIILVFCVLALVVFISFFTHKYIEKWGQRKARGLLSKEESPA